MARKAEAGQGVTFLDPHQFLGQLPSMHQTRILALTLIACGLSIFSGCDKLGIERATNKLPPGWSVHPEDFQFVTSPNGDAYVFHPATGKISRVTRDGLDTLTEGTQTLQIGKYYKFEDATKEEPFVKYIGGGKFEPSRFAVRPTSE